MFSSYFASITEHSFLCICKVFISKEFVRFSYGLGRFYASKRIIQSKDFDANVHAHSVSSAVQRVQCPFGRRWIMCNPFQGSNSLRGAKLSRIVIYRSWKTCFWSLVREIENSLRGAKNLFREIENSLRGANNLFRESENSFREKFIIAFGRQINPVLFLALTFFGRQWTTSFWKLWIRP